MSLAPSAPACPFCDPPTDRIFAEDERSFCLWDGYPVSPGHALIIPRRHVVNWFEASPAEQIGLVSRLSVAKAIIDERHRPDGYNIGINSGAAAGQTVFHLHIHLIPRFAGDASDPRGGVRHVIPAKGHYAGASEPSAPAKHGTVT